LVFLTIAPRGTRPHRGDLSPPTLVTWLMAWIERRCRMGSTKDNMPLFCCSDIAAFVCTGMHSGYIREGRQLDHNFWCRLHYRAVNHRVELPCRPCSHRLRWASGVAAPEKKPAIHTVFDLRKNVTVACETSKHAQHDAEKNVWAMEVCPSFSANLQDRVRSLSGDLNTPLLDLPKAVETPPFLTPQRRFKDHPP